MEGKGCAWLLIRWSLKQVTWVPLVVYFVYSWREHSQVLVYSPCTLCIHTQNILRVP